MLAAHRCAARRCAAHGCAARCRPGRPPSPQRKRTSDRCVGHDAMLWSALPRRHMSRPSTSPPAGRQVGRLGGRRVGFTAACCFHVPLCRVCGTVM